MLVADMPFTVPIIWASRQTGSRSQQINVLLMIATPEKHHPSHIGHGFFDKVNVVLISRAFGIGTDAVRKLAIIMRSTQLTVANTSRSIATPAEDRLNRRREEWARRLRCASHPSTPNSRHLR